MLFSAQLSCHCLVSLRCNFFRAEMLLYKATHLVLCFQQHIMSHLYRKLFMFHFLQSNHMFEMSYIESQNNC